MYHSALYKLIYILCICLFGSNVKASSYMEDRPLEEAVASAARSVVMYLENSTPFPLHRSQYRLEWGTWRREPPSEIPARG